MTERYSSSYDNQLIIIIMLLVAFGTIVMYSASSPFAVKTYADDMFFLKRHLIALVIGFTLLAGFMVIQYRALKYVAFSMIIGSFILLMLGYYSSPGDEPSRWLIYLQGRKMITISDMVRIAIIIYTAYYLEKSHKDIKNFKRGLLPYLILTGLLIISIAFQPDLSTALVLGLLVFLMLFIGGASIGHLLGLVAVALPVILFSLKRSSYQMARIHAWLHPELDVQGLNWQATHSKIAIGNGGILGQGLGDSAMKQGFLPEAYTDFIFSVISEELGFIVAAFILAMFFWLMVRGLKIAKNAPDSFGIFLTLGIVLNITLYFIVNVAYVTGFLPVTGLPMPFISYGGSHTICTLASMGILLSISRQSNPGRPVNRMKVYGR